MSKCITVITSGALALGLCATNTLAQSNTKPSPATDPATRTATAQDSFSSNMHAAMSPARASALIGTKIVDASGETIWEISDLVVGPSGDVVALVEHEDSGLFGIPLTALEAQLAKSDMPEAKAKSTGAPMESAPTADVERFTLDGERAMFDSAPMCNDAKLVDSAWLTRTTDHYAAGNDERSDPKMSKSKQPTSGMTSPVGRKPTLLEAILDMDVTATNGDTIGNLADVAIDLQAGRVAYAIVSVGGVLGLGSSLHAVEFDRLTVADDSIRTTMTEDSLAKLPDLDIDRLTATPVASASAPLSGSATGAKGRTDR